MEVEGEGRVSEMGKDRGKKIEGMYITQNIHISPLTVIMKE